MTQHQRELVALARRVFRFYTKSLTCPHVNTRLDVILYLSTNIRTKGKQRAEEEQAMVRV